MPKPILYVVGFAAPPVLELQRYIVLMKDRGWDCYITLSPTAASWLAIDRLRDLSGHTVRVNSRRPEDEEPFPPPQSIVAAPVTFNSLNKWAQGHNETVALGTLNEGIGLGLSITAAVWAKVALKQHPAYQKSVATLSPFARILDDLSTADGGSEAIEHMNWRKLAEIHTSHTVGTNRPS